MFFSTGFSYTGSLAISGALAGSPAPLAPGAEPPAFDESSSSGSLFATMGSRSSTPQHPPLLAQPRNSGPASPAHQLCASPRLGTAQGPLPDASKGDFPSEAGFSDPESEAKRRAIFTISASTSSTKQSPSNKHSPLPVGTRGDSSQSHGQDSRKRGRRKRASAGTPSLSSGVSPKRRALPSVASLFTQSSGSPLNLNSMVRPGRSGCGGGGGSCAAPTAWHLGGLPSRPMHTQEREGGGLHGSRGSAHQKALGSRDPSTARGVGVCGC